MHVGILEEHRHRADQSRTQALVLCDFFMGPGGGESKGLKFFTFFFSTTKPKAGESRQEVGHEVAAEVGMSSCAPEPHLQMPTWINHNFSPNLT